MSGPKSADYYLTAAQRAMLLEQQRLQRERELERQRIEREKKLERQRVQQETKRMNALTGVIDGQCLSIDKQMKRIDLLVRESGKGGEDAAKVRAAAENARKRSRELTAQKLTTSEQMKTRNAELQKVIDTLTKEVNESSSLSLKLSSDYKAELEETIQAGFSLSFAGIGSTKKRESIHLQRINQILAGISPDIPRPLQEKFRQIRQKADEITNVDFLENFCSVVVAPFAKTCSECMDYDEVKARYELLADECHRVHKVFDCSAAGIAEMKTETEALEAEVLAQREKEYINAALDAAMREMGYELVGDRVVTKKTGKRIRHELYSLKNGTAVDVTYAENGQISMELGGIGQNDRAPSADESEQLVEDMKSFCGDYSVLEKKMSERGVMTAKISHMPPSVEYAQIFNVNDYNVSKPVNNYQVKSERRHTKIVMHKE